MKYDFDKSQGVSARYFIIFCIVFAGKCFLRCYSWVRNISYNQSIEIIRPFYGIFGVHFI